MPRQISEERMRGEHAHKEMIDPQLETAGWYLRDYSKVKIEIPVDGYDAEPWNGVSDYCPCGRENGEVLAVVEARRTSTDLHLAEAQLTYYVTEIEKHQSFRPFGFPANGYDIYVEEAFANGTLAPRSGREPAGARRPGARLPRVQLPGSADERKALLIMAIRTGRTRTAWD